MLKALPVTTYNPLRLVPHHLAQWERLHVVAGTLREETAHAVRCRSAVLDGVELLWRVTRT